MGRWFSNLLPNHQELDTIALDYFDTLFQVSNPRDYRKVIGSIEMKFKDDHNA